MSLTFDIDVTGMNIQDQATHYEVYSFIGTERIAVIIHDDIATGFYKKYGLPITDAGKIKMRVDMGVTRKIRSLQNLQIPFDMPIGTIHSIDDIVYNRK